MVKEAIMSNESQQATIINLERLQETAKAWSYYFDERRYKTRAKWLIVHVMFDNDFYTNEIAAFLELDHSTISWYRNKYEPFPGEADLLEKLKEEF